ncbi:centriolar coiled coil protein 110kDa isoform X2 [Anticarsia gemmatalis]|uniref:centriolar coiled coil protein 110kDa isoform X2 n=1 Tax=Anticarsia gemmatalis TaxID=129554 RepID=UPI003F7719F6
MNDPWDVKSVRQSGQYVSCMKINGVPLLPPVLSKECRKEMQYYKLLAKEVEKRISLLEPYVFDSGTDSEDTIDAPELPECEQNYEVHKEEIQAIASPKFVEDENQNQLTQFGSPVSTSAKFYFDNLNCNNTVKNIHDSPQKLSAPLKDLPERDYNCVKRITQKVITEKEVITKVETKRYIKKNTDQNFSSQTDPFSELGLDGPASLSSKSFTGSLNDLHSGSVTDCQIEGGKMIRQRSYTLLKPGPQLLAHLEIHAQNNGIEVTSISMSESLSNLSSPNKKRRSWDLETAKEKWSNMALELQQKNMNVIGKKSIAKSGSKAAPKKTSTLRAKSVVPTPIKRNNGNSRATPKSEPVSKRRAASPVRTNHTVPPSNSSNRAVETEPLPHKSKDIMALPTKPTPISDSEDPATRVRDLYEKVQKQQLVQMASLVEKQKREQILLQQVFEEQNSLLFKQLKTICPKSPIEAKEAWGDKHCDGDRGPVSLSQLINFKSPEQSLSSPVTSTLTDTNNYINHCDNVLKKSRDITGSIKKQQPKSRSQNGTKIQSPRTQPEGNRTRTHSPSARNTATSRKLNYDTSASTDRDYEPVLTDRTNDTLADLNVTFPSDHSDEGSITQYDQMMHHPVGRDTNSHGMSSHTNSTIHSRSRDSAIKSMERTIQKSITSSRPVKGAVHRNPPKPEERAAATKIVAHVKGYLVRRLMRTERVQGIVQTIKDALLCALQLHQDREGIRGADVDLHRRLIQQITAACYSLHDTFVASSPAERCAMIAADRETFSGDKSSPVSRRYMASPRRRPWR